MDYGVWSTRLLVGFVALVDRVFLKLNVVVCKSLVAMGNNFTFLMSLNVGSAGFHSTN